MVKNKTLVSLSFSLTVGYCDIIVTFVSNLFIQEQMPFLLLELKSSLSYSTSNPEPSTYFFISEILYVFYDFLFNVILLKQLIQNIWIFNILAALILSLLVDSQFYASMSDFMGVWLNFPLSSTNISYKPRLIASKRVIFLKVPATLI